MNNDFDEQGYQVYVKYIAIKNHFTVDKYDFFRYNGKVRTNIDSFRTRQDKFSFIKLSKMKDYEDILVANLSRNPNKWIGEIVDESDGISDYHKWRKVNDAIEYNFKADISKLNDTSFESNFIVNNGNIPFVMNLYNTKKISLETFSILMHISKAKDYWLEHIADPVLTPKTIKLAEKYHPFMKYDMKKIMNSLESYFS